jgi:hypothetical protein
MLIGLSGRLTIHIKYALGIKPVSRRTNLLLRTDAVQKAKRGAADSSGLRAQMYSK